MGYRDDGDNSTRERRVQTQECGDRLRRHGGARASTCGFPFDSGDDVDADDNLIIDFDSDPILATLHATIP